MEWFLLAAAASAASAQVSSGTVEGEVRDESNAAVVNTLITARNSATGFFRTTFTGASGAFLLPDLATGAYTLTAEKSGFRSITTAGVMVAVNQRRRIDFRLQVGAAHDSVTVTARLPVVQTGDASEGNRMASETITRLPLAGRNLLSLVNLSPGAIPRHLSGLTHDLINDVQPARGAVEQNPPVNGARSTMNRYILDGAYNTNANAFTMAVIPPLDSVREFRVQSALGSAEFAQAGGGVIDVVTKSGGRALHGSLFEFARHEATDARNYFDNPSLPRPVLRQHQFGGSMGGPLPFSSTFIYGSYEGLRGESAKATLHLVPDAVIRTGDFSSQAPIYDPLTYNAASGARQRFAGNVIPPDRIDPIAKAFLRDHEPLPNLPAGGARNYLDATPNESRNDNGLIRIDHQSRSGEILFGRYTINEDRGRLAGNFPERPTRETLRAQQAALGFTAARSSWSNEARASFTRLRVVDVPESAVGLPYYVVNSYETVTDNTRIPQTQRDNTWALSNRLTYNRGRHTWKAGAEWVRFGMNYRQSSFPNGRYIFTGGFSGDSFADFLLGYAQSTRRTVGSAQAYLRQNSAGVYLQDEWRVTPRLALNLGVRYDYAAPFTEARQNLLNLDYSTLPQAPRLARVAAAVMPDRNNFSPRIGLVWRLPEFISAPGDTVFRAGYGVYFAPEIAAETYDLVRNNLRNEINETTGPMPVLTLAQGFPVSSSAGFPSYYGLDPRARTPYQQQWNGGFQRELAYGVLLDVAYVGSRGAKMGRFRTFNTPLHVETGENLAPRPGDLQSLRTFPQLGPIYQRQHIANSSYHSFQARSEKRLSSRLMFLASFVWSKSIDDADTVIPGLSESFGAQDERNLRLERGLSIFDVRRRFSAGFVFNLPAPRVARALLANWTSSGILTFQDGSPWNPVYFGTDFANSGTPNRPNLVAGQDLKAPAGGQTPEQWFNRAAFSAPDPFTFGNAGRNILPSPGNAVVDVAMQRGLALAERGVLQFRVEVFNVMNHPNLGIPGQYPDFGPFFGKIFASGQPRRMQFAARFDF